MIQVCSQCGTRWNVRDRQRVWCPRCRGTLLAPSGHASGQGWGPGQSPHPDPKRQGQPLPSGYRWVAVRPGAPPHPRRGRRELGPTPRYQGIPRWGLVEHFESAVEPAAQRKGPSPTAVQMTLVVTAATLGAAAFVHLVRYVLLIINRSVLLNPWVAGAATWGGVAVSVAAVFMTVASVVVLMNWLIARRAVAFAHAGQAEPRPGWALRLGCLVPFVNLLWAPVFVIELAGTEARLRWLQRSILVWWLLWVASTVVSVFAFATSFTADPQGIADNTVTTIVAYLFAAAALLAALKVFLGFEQQPVEKPARRWVMVAAGAEESEAPERPEPARAVESAGENPAA
ncbi:DUF4328 domain-containing protein [Mycolicibacterium vaccae]|jgi:hypothetical protein|uniref:DUF4328 domain-containing protein n=1 Tax=Mycolicibacterium vaccae TaxID=1810 RepID=UPI0002DBB2DD|nr:DUF4328 domain-containing protein [Mycolicibacterium vaccae]MCV7060182.1 DUF4328 domain-containing protein [Mycolicibacterium vaccae]